MPLYAELGKAGDFRRARGRKHSVARVLSMHILFPLCGMRGPAAAAQYAKNLSRKELSLLGGGYSRKKQRYEPPRQTTMRRVTSNLDAREFQSVLARCSAPRVRSGEAVAIDGKRIRGGGATGTGRVTTRQ